MARTRDYESRCCDNEFEFVECEDCGLVYMKNRPDESALDIIYSGEVSNYYDYNEYLGPVISRLRGIVQRMKMRPFEAAADGSVIVDVGCANGELLRILKKYGNPSWRLVGVDLAAESMANLAKHGIEGRRERFEKMSWSGKAPSVIVMNQVIEHLDDPRAAVEKAYEILEPGGVLMIETPSVEGWDAKLFRERYWGGYHTPRHWHLYKEDTLRDLLRGPGFSIVETTYLLSAYTWLHSFRFTLGDKYEAKRVSEWFQPNVFVPLSVVCALDVLQKAVRGKTSNMRMVGRKPA